MSGHPALLGDPGQNEAGREMGRGHGCPRRISTNREGWRSGDDDDAEVLAQLFQQEEGQHGVRDQPDSSGNETLQRHWTVSYLGNVTLQRDWTESFD